MTQTLDYPAATPPADTPMDIKVRLSIMMFLQYAIWGAWLPLMFPFFNEHRLLSAATVTTMAAVGAAGALIAPFIAGQIADRYFNTEKFLALSHFLGAILVWWMAVTSSLTLLYVFAFFYALLYTPTLALTNSLAFHHLRDRDREFGKVRVWGTIGWIAVGIGIGQWLLYRHTPATGSAAEIRLEQVRGMGDAFRVSAILGLILAAFCLLLPKTPPARGKEKFAPFEALGEVQRQPLLTLFLIAFPVACIHQFYFVRTAGYLGILNLQAPAIDKIFGVGGGGLMTIGQISEIAVLAVMPFVAKQVSRKTLLAIGLVAYILRFFIFAYLPHAWAIIPGLTLHGLCFGCFFFIAFMIVDEQTTKDVRASAQNLFNLIIVGFGVIVGNLFAGWVDTWALRDGKIDWRVFFSIPMYIAVACLLALLVFYPRRSRVVTPTGGTPSPAEEPAAAAV
jgi:nucleoside transporter